MNDFMEQQLVALVGSMTFFNGNEQVGAGVKKSPIV